MPGSAAKSALLAELMSRLSTAKHGQSTQQQRQCAHRRGGIDLRSGGGRRRTALYRNSDPGIDQDIRAITFRIRYVTVGAELLRRGQTAVISEPERERVCLARHGADVLVDAVVCLNGSVVEAVPARRSTPRTQFAVGVIDAIIVVVSPRGQRRITEVAIGHQIRAAARCRDGDIVEGPKRRIFAKRARLYSSTLSSTLHSLLQLVTTFFQ
jgi:hypothetical protein